MSRQYGRKPWLVGWVGGCMLVPQDTCCWVPVMHGLTVLFCAPLWGLQARCGPCKCGTSTAAALMYRECLTACARVRTVPRASSPRLT
jgi:hypothetical protein